MTYTDIFYIGPEMNVCGYYGDYRLSPGKVTVESWMADILINHGYGLSLKPGDESHERRNKNIIKRLEQAIKKIFRKEAN